MHLFELLPLDLLNILGIYLDQIHLNILYELFGSKFDYQVLLLYRYPAYFTILNYLINNHEHYSKHTYEDAYILMNRTEKVINCRSKYGRNLALHERYSDVSSAIKPSAKLDYVTIKGFIAMVSNVHLDLKLDDIIVDYLHHSKEQRYRKLLNASKLLPYQKDDRFVMSSIVSYLFVTDSNKLNMFLSERIEKNPFRLFFHCVENKVDADKILKEIHKHMENHMCRYKDDILLIFEYIIEYLQH
jgi:hypothetical protein